MNRLFAVATVTVFSLAGIYAQDNAKQDMKDAGHETKEAAKDAGQGVAKGSKKVGRKVVKGTKKTGHVIKKDSKKAVHAGAEKTAEGAEKVERSTDNK